MVFTRALSLSAHCPYTRTKKKETIALSQLVGMIWLPVRQRVHDCHTVTYGLRSFLHRCTSAPVD